MEHVCVPNRPRGIFCECGAVVDRAGLRQVRLSGFTGAASLKDTVQDFFETGDPDVLTPRA